VGSVALASKDEYFRIRNFEKFQHYKHRNPPWIKLYRDLWRDIEFSRLSDSSKAHLIGMFMLASRTGNKIPFDSAWLARELATTEKVDFAALIKSNFLIPVGDFASAMLARYKQNAPLEIEKETETEIEKEGEKDISSEPSDFGKKNPSAGTPENIFIAIPTNIKGKSYPVTEDYIKQQSEFYPALNIHREIRAMVAWSYANPTKRKTYRGMTRFINSWLSSEQNKAGGNGNRTHYGKPGYHEVHEKNKQTLVEIMEEEDAKARES